MSRTRTPNRRPPRRATASAPLPPGAAVPVTVPTSVPVTAPAPAPPGPAVAPTRAPRSQLTVIAAVLGVYAVTYMLWVAFHWGGDPVVVSDVAPIPMAGAAASLAWWAAHDGRAAPRRRAAWRWIAFGCVSWLIAEVMWWYLDAVRHVSPFPSPADAFHLGFYVLLFVGLMKLPARREVGAERVALGLDLATVAVVTFMFVWYLVALPTIHGTDGMDLGGLLAITYPLADMILVLGIARVLMRRRSGADGRTVLWFLVAAASVLAFADITFARLDLAGRYTPGSLPDGLWVGALLLLALAALAQLGLTPPGVSFVGREQVYASVSKLPYVAMVLGLALVLYETTRDARGPLAMLVLSALALTVLVVVRQLTVLHDNDRLAGELHRLATTDPLTELANRRHFFEVAELMLARAGREPVAVVMIDVDRFKAINDGFGHSSGDEVIHEVAQRCATAVRPTDLLARYGGDELVAVFVGTIVDEAADIAARLRTAVASTPIETATGPVRVTLSIGVGAAPAGATLDDLLRAADVALYRAKAAGRDGVAGELLGPRSLGGGGAV